MYFAAIDTISARGVDYGMQWQEGVSMRDAAGAAREQCGAKRPLTHQQSVSPRDD